MKDKTAGHFKLDDATQLSGNELSVIGNENTEDQTDERGPQAASTQREGERDSISSEALGLGLDQQQIDSIMKGVPGGAENVQDIYALSPLQEGMLFHHLMSQQGDAYLLSIVFEVQSRTHVDLLIGALEKVIARHDILRTAVLWENLPRPVQVVYRRATLPIVELSVEPGREPLDQLKEEMEPHRQKLDLTQAPLMRLQVVGSDDGEQWYCLLQIHHLVCDFQSWDIVVAEAMAFIRGRGETLPTPTAYRNYVAHVVAHGREQDAEAFFRSKLGDVDEPTAPFGLFDVHGDGTQVREAREPLDPALAQQVRTQARRFGVSPARLFHAAWGVVVARTSGRDDVVFGTVLLARRGTVHTQPLLGMFVNTLPLRLRLHGVTVQQLVEQTHRELAELLNHQATPLALAQRCSSISSTAPLFTALLNYRRGAPIAESADVDPVGVRVLSRRGVWTNYPMALSVDDLGEGFILTAQSDPRIDPGRVVGYVSAAVQSLVQSLEHAPHTPALALSILPESERKQVIESFNATQVTFPRDKLIHRLFEERVEQTPDAFAVAHGGQRLTYAQLNRRANQLAHALLAHDVRPDERIGLCVERSMEMVVGLLGILKAGGAYVPLDASYPVERLKHMIRDSAPVAFVTQQGLEGNLPVDDVLVLLLDVDSIGLNSQSDDNPDALQLGLRPYHLASVIYTSGSTGTPKGVMVEHAGLCNLAYMQIHSLDVQPHSRVLQFASLSFDACTWECVMALCSGACLCIGSRDDLAPGEPLLTYMRSEKITHATLPPVALNALSSSSGLELRALLVAGEACPVALARQWGTQRRFINAYGPTEATVCATMHPYEPQDMDSIPIGRPIANAQIYILDHLGEPAPIGVSGEIHIGGAGVARGYLGRPQLTAERFIRNPFSAEGRARLYKTGDIGRWRADGNIEFLGRNDHQVKIRGFRVELGEIETQLTRHEQVKEAAVVPRDDVPGGRRLVAYVTPRGNNGPRVEDLRRYLKDVLPEYMIPSAFVIRDTLPLTPNGKIDRRALPAPELEAYTSGQYETPHGQVEELLAGIWRDVLQLERVGRGDNFFDLGGHSLLAIKSLVKINQYFGCALRVTDIYKNAVLRDLAARIGGRVGSDECIDLGREATLPEDIVALPGHPCTPARHVLLTGATGFVGRFLLVQLLQNTDATIFCIVRADTQHQAFSRLKSTLVKWDLWRNEFDGRVVAIPGDVGQPRLGLDEPAYELLSEKIDSIYDCATSMNHLETYAMAKRTNVGAAQEMLRLATRCKPKLINYISSLSVFRSPGSDVSRIVTEDSPIEHERHSTANGYVASKWVAEKILMIAAARGIPCNIFRVGLVWADTRRGRYDELQQGDRVFKSCLLSGYGIEGYRYQMPPTPVDYVARSIVFLANRHAHGKGIFHISSSHQPIDGVFERCNEIAGTSLQLIPYYDWICEIKRMHQQGQSLPVVPLIEFAFSMDEPSFHEHQRGIPVENIRVDCTRTQRELESAGIVAPVLDDDLLALYVENILCADAELQETTDRNSELMFPRRGHLKLDGLSRSGT